MQPADGNLILVVDDEAEIRTLLRRALETSGYRVEEAGNGTEMRRKLSECGEVSLITLDVGLGGEDGFTLAREVRAAANVPIIMITGKDDPIDRVVGLELGADDYIVKPFHLREVLARVKAVLRRYEVAGDAAPTISAKSGGSETPRYAFAGYILDPARRQLTTTDGGSVDLTTAEFNMLAMFVERPTRVLSRDNIMDLLKGHEWSPYDRSIDTLVGRLRKKIEADVDRPSLIKTVRGVGYVFAADVREA